MNVDIINNRRSIIMAITDGGGIGPRMFQQLLMHLGAPEDFLSASYSDFKDIPRLGEEKIEKLMNSLEKVDDYDRKLKEYSEIDIYVVTFLDSEYPELLRKINEPPPILYIKGERDAFSKKYIAIVGTTKPNQDGIRLAIDLSRALVGEGFGIISGLAAGVDSAAHLGALKENGRTIAVLGCGIMKIYPQENILLSRQIEKSGLLVSEHDPHTGVTRPNLVLRNRIISGLSSAVVVAQIGEKTAGELKTASCAIKQAKPLFYGNPDGRLDYGRIENLPGVILGNVDPVEEITKYII
ncbi:MAG: DNA-protecting protein DprA [Candidatus Zixiibacteriota bacterium]|nr:MAG: DNA-protecting protein DprA [candidate division Zixibacteria bacterium]